MAESYHVYILQDATGAYYVGYTSDVAARVLAHQTGRGGPHTKKLISLKLVYSEPQSTLEAAVKREMQIKGWSRAKKHALIEGRLDDLKKLSLRQS
ncbi:MAG TPA: GIY-YIG nuclease family protein [Lacunisphaera sp.]|jgi:predicted GIY-YIG superfamily endonuclease